MLLSAVLAAGISYWLYYHRSKIKSPVKHLLAGLRFLALLSVFLLLINPKYERKVFTIEKSDLIVLVDNSKSIVSTDDRQYIAELLEQIGSDNQLANRFNLHEFVFGEAMETVDSLDYQDRATNISNALDRITQLYPEETGAILLLSDGNQTLGEDYSFRAGGEVKPVYPIVLGDTTQYEDLRIDRVNMNNYAFLGNRYPVEILISYQGSGSVNTTVSLTEDGITRFRRELRLNASDNTGVVTLELEAQTTGLKDVEIQLTPLEGERNTANNSRRLGLEVIDEQTRVALVTEVVHPDIGALKTAIEENEQREVTVVPPAEMDRPEEFDLFIFYRPTSRFGDIIQYTQDNNSPLITIAVPGTDWRFLNRAQNSFNGNRLGTVEEVVPVLNSSFGLFDLGGFTTDGYPPLDVDLGDFIVLKPHEVLMEQRIKGVDMDEPLLLLITDQERREAVVLGEHLWKWRIQEFRNTQNFDAFDELWGKILFYLAATPSKERLTVDYEKNVRGTSSAVITARYFDEAFEFNPNATLTLLVRSAETQEVTEIPMLLKNRFYEANIGALPPGDYPFTVRVDETDLSRQGRFKILEYDVEHQLISSDFTRLSRLAGQTEGRVYFPGADGELLDELRENPRFTPVRKSTQNVVSLIDFKILLAIIAAALAAEWFIRKYHGLI